MKEGHYGGKKIKKRSIDIRLSMWASADLDKHIQLY
jgi:hypothetical protein